MAKRIFLAGAAGAIGRILAPLLRDAGHHIVGTTRSAEKAALLRKLGIEPVIVDVFDALALARIVAAARPDTIIHQLTDLPPGLDPAQMADAVKRNARLRSEGTRNLVQAALGAGVTRIIAQSIAWAYQPGPLPYSEDAPLDLQAEGARAISVGGVSDLERCVLNAPPITGVVLRYGQLYGPGTGTDAPSGASPLHVDAAAHAALLCLGEDASGIYNVAEPNDSVATIRIQRALGWSPRFRRTHS